MPHCNKGVLESLEQGRKPTEAGELTANIYKECVEFTVRRGRGWGTYCIVMGSLIGCLLEFYRRKVAKYEDEKMAENGEYLGGLG